MPWHSCPPLSPLPASYWGVCGLSTVQLLQRMPPAPPHRAPLPPLLLARQHGPLWSLSSLWGVRCPHSQVEIFKAHPNSHPSGFPYPSAMPPANGAHMYSEAGWRQAQPAKNVVGSLPGCRDALKGALREPTGKAASSSRLEPLQETPSEWGACHGCQMLQSGVGTGGRGARSGGAHCVAPAGAAEWPLSVGLPQSLEKSDLVSPAPLSQVEGD